MKHQWLRVALGLAVGAVVTLAACAPSADEGTTEPRGSSTTTEQPSSGTSQPETSGERRRGDHGFDLDIHDNRHGVNYNGVDDNRFGIDVRRRPNEHASGADFSQRHPAGR